MLVLYSATILDSFYYWRKCYHCFPVVSQVHDNSICKQKLLSLLILTPVIVLVNTSRLRLNHNGDRRHIFFVLNFSGTASSIFPLSWMLALRMSYIFSIKLNFVQRFFNTSGNIPIMFFSLDLLIYHFSGFPNREQAYTP